MKLRQIILENFRGYKERTYIKIEDFTAIIGRNDVGKSTILEALDIFFENSKPDPADGCIAGDLTKVRIGCVFSDFPDAIVIDSSNATTLSNEFLLNSDGMLEIHKLYNCTASKPKCDSVVAFANHPSQESCVDLLSMPNTKLKALAKELKVKLESVNLTKNSEIRNAIRAVVGELNIVPMEVSLNKESGAEVWSSLSNYLPIYALFKSDRPSSDQDEEAQDPMKAAIKIAVKEQQEQLRALTDEVKLKVQEIADLTVKKLSDFSSELASSLHPTITTKSWDSLFSVSLSDENHISVNKRGSGVRRLILLNFFRAKAELAAKKNSNSNIIYAIEEPETSQYPHNQRLLIETLQELVEDHGCQILITTHTPVLVKALPLKSIVYIKNQSRRPGPVANSDSSFQEIAKELGIVADHNVKCFFGVEGKNDIAFLRTISRILHQNDSTIPNLEEAESTGKLVFIPLGGSNLNLWVSRLNELNRPTFYLMDRDTAPPAQPKYKTEYDAFIAENHTAWITEKKELENYLHKSIITSHFSNYDGAGADHEDVPLLLAKAIHLSDTNSQASLWDDVLVDQEKLRKKVSAAKRKINHELINNMTVDLLSESDQGSEIVTWLRSVGTALI